MKLGLGFNPRGRDLDKCSLCGRLRAKDRRDYKESWRTDLIIYDTLHRISLDHLTICPDCRSKPIGELYQLR